MEPFSTSTFKVPSGYYHPGLHWELFHTALHHTFRHKFPCPPTQWNITFCSCGRVSATRLSALHFRTHIDGLPLHEKATQGRQDQHTIHKLARDAPPKVAAAATPHAHRAQTAHNLLIDWPPSPCRQGSHDNPTTSSQMLSRRGLRCPKLRVWQNVCKRGLGLNPRA